MEIAGYPNYIISDRGEIYNKKRKIIMKQRINNWGYFWINLRNNGNPKTLLVHRLVYQAYNLESGEAMPAEVDHMNGIKTDNYKDNLRGATSSQNCRNIGTRINNTSGHKNIHVTPNGTFTVEIKHIKRYSKTFKTLEEAVIDRDIKLVEFHGEFANIG